MEPKVKFITATDAIFWSIFCFVPLGLGIGVHLTKQDFEHPLAAWIILWSVIAGMWAVAISYFVRRWNMLKKLRFVSKDGIIIGWTYMKYAVFRDEVESEVAAVIRKMSKYGDVTKALKGCVVMFVEPEFWCWPDIGFVARKVAGMQDGALIYVGWRQTLSISALQHELAHRILQVFAGDPPEKEAHAIMSELGIT